MTIPTRFHQDLGLPRCRLQRRRRSADLALAVAGAGPYPDVDFRQLDSWIVIRQDNTATFFVGKTDLGQGTGTAFRQIMADELDMPYDKTAASWAIPT